MNVIKEVNEFETRIKQRYTELYGSHQKYDLAEQDILHYIEFEKCDAIISAKLMKKLKEIRKDRREIKDEFEALQSVTRRLSNAGLSNFKRPEKTYTYRTVTLEGILKDD